MKAKNRFLSLSKDEAIQCYMKHKYRKCNGFFDAKMRGSVSREMVEMLKESFGLTDADIDRIDTDIDRDLGRE